MKKTIKQTMLKKLMAAILILTVSFGILTACETKKKDTMKIGVIQFAQHASLDNCYDGLIAGFEAAGYTIGENLEVDHQNANADSNLANQIAQNMASRDYDLIIGIATPAAQAAYNAARKDDIPVLFTAVTDPVMAGFTNEDGSPKKGITGTADTLPVEAQLKMIRAFFPDAKTIGILYSLNESNSISSIASYEALADRYDFTIVTEAVSEASVIPAATDSLLQKVDILTNLTDNLVVENMPVIISKANAASIPYFGSEIEQVTNGCIAAEGIDYLALGKQTGEMGASILNGTAAESIAIRAITDSTPFHNSNVMNAFNLELPADYSDSEDVAK